MKLEQHIEFLSIFKSENLVSTANYPESRRPAPATSGKTNSVSTSYGTGIKLIVEDARLALLLNAGLCYG